MRFRHTCLLLGQCDRWVTGYERAGEYVITATSADGTRTAHAGESRTDREGGLPLVTVVTR